MEIRATLPGGGFTFPGKWSHSHHVGGGLCLDGEQPVAILGRGEISGQRWNRGFLLFDPQFEGGEVRLGKLDKRVRRTLPEGTVSVEFLVDLQLRLLLGKSVLISPVARSSAAARREERAISGWDPNPRA